MTLAAALLAFAAAFLGCIVGALLWGIGVAVVYVWPRPLH